MTDVEDVQRLGLQALYRLVLAVERRSGGFGSHSKQTSNLVAAVAGQLGLSEASRELLAGATLFHDIGNFAIPHGILARTEPLDSAERAVVETHTEIGSWLLGNRDSPVLDLAAVIALQHHENLDGSGYPHGLAGDEISLEARIVRVCDVFGALTGDRTYRPAFTVVEALRIVVADAGSKFDPAVVDGLTSVVPEWEHLCAA